MSEGASKAWKVCVWTALRAMSCALSVVATLLCAAPAHARGGPHLSEFPGPGLWLLGLPVVMVFLWGLVRSVRGRGASRIDSFQIWLRRSPVLLDGWIEQLEAEARLASDSEVLLRTLKRARRLRGGFGIESLPPPALEPIDVAPLISRCAEAFEPECQSRGIRLQLRCTHEAQAGETAQCVLVEPAELDALFSATLADVLDLVGQQGEVSIRMSAAPGLVRVHLALGSGPSRAGQQGGKDLHMGLRRLVSRLHGLLVPMGAAVSRTDEGVAPAELCIELPAVTVAVRGAAGSEPALLPVARVESSQPANDTRPASLRSIPGADGQTVLVVDDGAEMRALLARELGEHGYEVLQAADGQEALELARTARPELVITDWMMPGMSGPDLVAALRREEAIASTPVILLTARSTRESRMLGMETGADAFIAKPFSRQELLFTARNLLRLKTRERELEGVQRDLTLHLGPTEDPRQALVELESLASIGQLIASIAHEIGNPVGLLALNSELIPRFLQNLERRIEALPEEQRGGLGEAVADLRESLETNASAVDALIEISDALGSRARYETTGEMPVSLHVLAEEALVMLGARTRPFELERQLDEVTEIECFRNQLGQVVVALIQRATQELELVTRRAREQGERFAGCIRVVTANCDRDGARGVALTVSHNGKRVAQAVSEYGYDEVRGPLGPEACARIVGDHGGQLSLGLDPETGGPSVEIWLPAAVELAAGSAGG